MNLSSVSPVTIVSTRLGHLFFVTVLAGSCPSAAPNSVSDQDFKALRQYGLSNAETMEVAMVPAFANFINWWADASGILTDPD